MSNLVGVCINWRREFKEFREASRLEGEKGVLLKDLELAQWIRDEY